MPPSLFAENPFALWAKLPRAEKSPDAFHPLLCHMIDVAVVAGAMWRDVLSATTRRSISAALGLSESQAEGWILYLAALHDLGKASPAFQLRVEAQHLATLYSSLGAAPPGIKASDCPHGRVTAKELPELLRIDKALAKSLSVAIGGHHGLFPTSDDLLNRCRMEGTGRGAWKQVRKEIVEYLADLLEIPPDVSPQRVDHAALMFIAGLVSVADWIGSNDEFFEYLVSDWRNIPQIDPRDYLSQAALHAQGALNRLGWAGWAQSTEALSFNQLFPFSPRPLQRAAVSVAEKMRGIGIVIVEAPMGEGKTEAALYLADHWGIAAEPLGETPPGVRGCYVALPTQATSNQMFRRVRQFLAQRYPKDVVNLQLLHGHAALSAEFQTMKANGNRVFSVEGVYSDAECTPQAMSVVAAEWFTHRKRGLLAPFGVGTVDQALMAVLQTKHVFVRLFGLAHKTVIIDEVHAYDAYMSKLLERLLEWLAALGSPVVLLSATLPSERRRALLEAYRRGLNAEAMPMVIKTAPVSYPRLTWATKITGDEESIEVSAHASRTLQLVWVDGRIPVSSAATPAYPLGEQLRIALAGGGCAAVICNTVNRGLVWNLLRKEVPEAWQHSALLRHHRLIELNGDGRWSDGTYQIYLDEKLGVVISKLKEAENA